MHGSAYDDCLRIAGYVVQVLDPDGVTVSRSFDFSSGRELVSHAIFARLPGIADQQHDSNKSRLANRVQVESFKTYVPLPYLD
jgi:hypothetical protein